MSPEELLYYRERALIERARAATASSVAAEIHLELACLYERLVDLEEAPKAKLHIVTDGDARATA